MCKCKSRNADLSASIKEQNKNKNQNDNKEEEKFKLAINKSNKRNTERYLAQNKPFEKQYRKTIRKLYKKYGLSKTHFPPTTMDDLNFDILFANTGTSMTDEEMDSNRFTTKDWCNELKFGEFITCVREKATVPHTIK